MVVAVPFLLAAVALKVLFTLILLPFKIVAALFKGIFGLVFGLWAASSAWSPEGSASSAASSSSFWYSSLLPLAPLLLLGGVVWLALKAFGRPPGPPSRPSRLVGSGSSRRSSRPRALSAVTQV